jgi:hypothetical protein
METEGWLLHSQQTPSMPILSQIKPVRAASHSLKIRFNTILPNYAHVFQVFSFPRVSQQNLYPSFLVTINAIWPTHVILSVLMTPTIFGEA